MYRLKNSKKSHTGYRYVNCVLVVMFLAACSSSQEQEEIPTPVNSTRIIEFSGYEWIVRDTDDKTAGPGPNYFSDSEENVWVDNQGRLHLKITENAGLWSCAGITLRNSYGFKKYVFYVASNVDALDKNVVGGLFSYTNDEEEIDIEFSKWSQDENENSQFAIQPSYLAGNKSRYGLNLNGKLSTHYFDWQADVIEFGSYLGHTLTPGADDVISEWSYTGDNIPPAGDERIKINLWLFKGARPSNDMEQEMIIDHFEIQ
ncbi:MAG: hypothetical protein CL868_21210 [Cytophagaceae bacterium]|nr:hypothetical protein [Cytophagaceae bacterium]